MRHSASLLASLEGMSRTAYRIARELASNSRSGLTVRFLSKKLDLPVEEIEYLLDVNPRLMFLDLTKIKLVPEGHQAIKRISDGLENLGDVPALMQRVKAMQPPDFRRLEEQLGIESPSTKKGAAEDLINRFYRHPDSVVSYVATSGFSATAREVFDIVWQSKNGVMPISQLRVAHGGPEFEVEQALWELFRGCALFEMFRFDSEERLVRVAGLLSEIRQFGEQKVAKAAQDVALKPVRGEVEHVESRELHLSDAICRLVAAIAARPARLRGDGELFREDRRRLAEICPVEADPSLNTCLWVAEGAGWLTRVDNTLCAGELEELIKLNRVNRQETLAKWLLGHGDEAAARHMLIEVYEDLQTDAWYEVTGFVRYCTRVRAENEQPVLKPCGGHWSYIRPSATGKAETRMARALEEVFFWLGIVDRAEKDGRSVFRLTPIADCLLCERGKAALAKRFPPRPAEFVVQPNFDIVVPTQDIDPLLTVPLDQFAQRVSTGQVTVYNLSKESYTQAVQEGHDAGSFTDFLMHHNRDSLPRNVMTTLEDWRGAIKRVRLRTVHILETDDPLVMADLMHRRRLEKYLQPIDPHTAVRYGKVNKSELAKALEKDGFIVE